MASNPGSSPPVEQQADAIEAAPQEELEGQNDDADSALGEDAASSSASVSSSILQYRTLHGRTYHSERHNTEYFAPNDDQASESIDLTHHYLTLLLNGKLHTAPLDDKKLQKAVDIGTGTGIWAIDFADAHPNTEVIGTDLSPTQPIWVPPNVKFEIDDALQSWTWPDNTFDFVHMRYLSGSVTDWNALLAEAYRVCKPGGYAESCEVDVGFSCDDGTTDGDYASSTWTKLFKEAGKKSGRSFTVLEEDLQRKALEAAGFVDIGIKTIKCPVGGWARDPNLAEVGRFVQLTILNDLEGYTMFLWKNVLEWPDEEYQVFTMKMRKYLRVHAHRNKHSYMTVRYAYGRKPE